MISRRAFLSGAASMSIVSRLPRAPFADGVVSTRGTGAEERAADPVGSA
jgi:hypothetical protein